MCRQIINIYYVFSVSYLQINLLALDSFVVEVWLSHQVSGNCQFVLIAVIVRFHPRSCLPFLINLEALDIFCREMSMVSFRYGLLE